MLMSFISILDGYYRLTYRWTFNLCGDALTPSLVVLHELKCHGPVGGEFSYSCLKEKRENRPGTFILRESETAYDVFYIDTCGNDRKPRTYKVEKRTPEDYILTDFGETYKSLRHLISAHQDPSGQLYLIECLPSSEYDKSPLLLCAGEETKSDVVADEEVISNALDSRPCIIPSDQLQVYDGQPFPKNRDTVDLLGGLSPKTTVYRAMWRVVKGKKLEAAIKLLKNDEWKYCKDFLDMAGKWSQLKSKTLVRLYGMTIEPTVGMVLELAKLGPLDAYLRNTSPDKVKTVDMVEAAARLATAVWYLEERRIIHGNIRCRKLLVHAHTESNFIVKLADPGLFNYTFSDIHWISPECHNNLDLARVNRRADIWAVGTTLWQIFSRGTALPVYHDMETVKKFYASGRRLPIPKGCPPEVYKLMLECWGKPGGSQKQPQAIMRDTNRIFHQVFNSRRRHVYAIPFPKLFNDTSAPNPPMTSSNALTIPSLAILKNIDDNEMMEINSLSIAESRHNSLPPNNTTLPWEDLNDFTCVLDRIKNSSSSIQDSTEDLSTYVDWLTEHVDDSDILESGMAFYRATENGLFGQMQSIFELDANCNVILQGRIGQGFYGEVYLGMLEREGREQTAPQHVAIKKLKLRAVEEDLRDFEREINIMKSLKHPNIVQILGVISEPEVCLVMEFIRHGSLQSYLSIHRENLTHKQLLSFSLDIATGMNYLGSKSIVHRDLAARNILVSDDNCVKISDFGLAQVTGRNNYYILQTNRDLPIKWYAPESLRDGKFSAKSDVWSFGVTMYEMFSFGEDPKLPVGSNICLEQEGSSEFLVTLERGTRLPCPPTCPQIVYVKLMFPCWYMDSHQRPGFTTLCSDIRNIMTEI